jgi:2-keto-3-deoxy-L-rhamnonate aldolase RhmA
VDGRQKAPPSVREEIVLKNRILEKFRAHEPSVGTITHMKSMSAIEALGTVGLDYIFLDMEHCPVSVDEMARYICAADAAGLTPVVHVSEGTRAEVLRALDVGAKGIIVPCIETVEQVRELVRCAKFPPLGDRGYCMSRDGGWGYSDAYAAGLAGYMETANRDTLLLPQCETVGCLEHVEEIVRLDGVDGILIGPYDLSIAMGMAGDFDAPPFRAALERIRRACKDAGKICMIFSGTAADARLRLAEGYDSALTGLDVIALISAYQTMMQEIRNKK